MHGEKGIKQDRKRTEKIKKASSPVIHSAPQS